MPLSTARRGYSIKFTELLLLAMVLFTIADKSVQAEALPEMPAARREAIMRQLTPVEEILKMESIPSAKSDAGSVLLSERITTVDKLGRRVITLHSAYKALSEAGVHTIADDITQFHKKDQRVYLLLAETIQPDGSRLPVKTEAVFVQSPQRQAEYSLYDDQSELKVIFPNVKPGSVSHLIVVIEDLVARMPGEFSQSRQWKGSWALGLDRNRIVLPPEMASRLKVNTVGSGVPTPIIENQADGQVAYTWKMEKQAGSPYEIDAPPGNQIGPAIHLSTVKSWDEIAAWYRELLRGRDQLGESLAKQADAWTAKAKNETETIAILHAKVADEVRYVGLEFDAGDYQPHHCKEVWENQYGDCKDKANLLVALLRHRGIKACIALVNTMHLGLVDQRSPDFRVFSHAIVAIPQAKSGYLFCDPTISFSEPGMLGSGSSDRDVLVIGENGADWVRTPANGVGSVTYQFDLKLAANGELSGWLNLNAEGIYGAGERHRFGRLDAVDARSEMSKIVRGFFQGAEVVDIDRPEVASRAAYKIKAYFIVAGRASESDSTTTLNFPSSSALFADLGNHAERQTTFFMVKDFLRANATITLPPGLNPKKLPEPFNFDSKAGTSHAEWKFENGICRTDLQLNIKQSYLAPEEFRQFYEGAQSLQTWLERPALFGAANTPATQSDLSPPQTELDLPMMPTGDGQIDLVDRRYPDTGNTDARRAALDRTLQYFPKDQVTVFRAGVRLGLLEWDAGRTQTAHDRVSRLLRSHSGLVNPETYSWADLNDALMLRDLHQTPEAIARLQLIAKDTKLSSSRRIEAATNAADLMLEGAPQKALILLQETSALPDADTAAIESRIAHLLLLSNKPEELKERLSRFVQSRPDSYEKQLTTILEQAPNWKLAGDDRNIATLADMAISLCKSPGEALRKASHNCLLETTCRRMNSKLSELLTAKPLSEWYAPDAKDKLTCLTAFQKAIDEAAKNEDPALCLRLSLQALLSFGTEGDFPRRLWRTANFAEWLERKDHHRIDGKVCDTLLDLCDQLPPTHRYNLEGRFVRANRFERDGERAAQQAILKTMITIPDLDTDFLSPCCKKLGDSQEAGGDYQGALTTYKLAEPIAVDYAQAADCLLHATFINLSLGQDDEAIRLITFLAKAPEATINATTSPAQIRELVQLVQNGHAQDFWSVSRKWWPQWKSLAGDLEIPERSANPVVPGIASLTSLGEEFGRARNAGDKQACFRQYALLASAARWQPSLASELAGLSSYAMQLSPANETSLRRFTISVLSIPHPAGMEGLRARQLQLAAQYVDAQQAADSLKVVKQFNRVDQPNDNITRVMNRIWALAALAAGQELESATQHLESDLSDPTTNQQRSTAVKLLADLYRRLGREKNEEDLLTREIDNPIIQADTTGRTTLIARRDQFIGSRKFAETVGAWIKSIDLPWYDDAEPINIGDPRVQNVDSVLARQDMAQKHAEQIKLLLLASQDTRQSYENRQQYLRRAINLLITKSTNYRQIQTIASSVVDNPAFDDETRLQALWNTLLVLSDGGRKVEYQAWRSRDQCKRFNEATLKKLAFVDLFAEVERTSSASILALADKISAEEITTFGGLVMEDLFAMLFRLGDLSAAEKLAASVANWKLAADVQGSLDTIQLQYLRHIQQAKPRNAVHDALASVVLKHFPTAPTQPPEYYTDLRMSMALPTTTPAATLQACLFQIKTSQFVRNDMEFWSVFLRALPQNVETEKLVAELAHTAISSTDQDDLRAETLMLFLSNVDTDNPKNRQSLESEFNTCRQPTKFPICYSVIRMYELTKALRLGQRVEFETVFADVNDSRAQYGRQFAQIRHYLQAGNRIQLQRSIANLDTGTLLSPHSLTNTLPALEYLGLDSEMRIAREVATRELRSAVVNSWAGYDTSAGSRAAGLAELLGNSSLLPSAWVATLSSSFGDPLLQHRIKIAKALLDSDWVQVEALAATLNRDYPTHYHYFWYRGLALYKLGRNSEAKKALSTYTQYSKDELEYPKALEILKKIGGSNR